MDTRDSQVGAALIAALTPVVTDLVRDEVARVLGLGVETTYRMPAPLPAATTPRTFAAACRSGIVQGAVKEGRTWSCTRAAWHAARRRSAPVTCSASPHIQLDDQELARRALESAGMRVTTTTTRRAA